MDSVLSAIDQRRAELTAELAKLDAARAALAPSQTSSAANTGLTGRVSIQPLKPFPKKDAAPTEPSASASDATKRRPGRPPKLGGQPNPSASPLTLAQCRDRVKALLTANGPQTTKQLMQGANLSAWQVAKAVAGWDEVTHTEANIRSPYCLKPVAGPTV